MTEEQFLAEVMARCEQRGIVAVHNSAPHHSRRRYNLIGYPDLALWAPRQVAYVELKGQGQQLASEQRVWRDRIVAAGQVWRMWRPSDLESGLIDDELDALAAGRQRAGPDDVDRDFAAAMAASRSDDAPGRPRRSPRRRQ